MKTFSFRTIALALIVAAAGFAASSFLVAPLSSAVIRDSGSLDGGGGGIDGGGAGGGGGTVTYQCSDGVDNDSNGLTDYPADLGCTSGTDNTETGYVPPKQCGDGLDNDGNGFIDYPSDAGCTSTTDNAESGYHTQCTDGLDNDSNGKTDYPADYGCASKTDTAETGYIPPATASSGLIVYKTQSKRDYYNVVKPDQWAHGGVDETAAHSGWPAASVSSAQITDTGKRICYLYDPTATITEWSLGGFDSPSNNSMAAWDVTTSLWKRSSAGSFGNKRYNYLTCKTWAPPEVTLTASKTDIVAGDSLTLTWGSANQRQGTFTPTNFSNTIFIPGHQETNTNLFCNPDNGGSLYDDNNVYYAGVSPRSQLGLPTGNCWYETTSYWVPDQTITVVNGSRTVSPTETTTYTYKGTNVNGSWYESVTVNVTQPTPQCRDGQNNDTDAWTDYPSDPGCTNANDTTESPNPQCSDGLDNDNDGRVDYSTDLQCDGTPSGPSEYTECADGIDNDGTGGIDLADTDCGNNAGNDSESTPPPQVPAASLSANPTSVVSGNASVLTWSCTHSTSASIMPTIGSVSPVVGGTVSTGAMSATTGYTLTCTGAGGTTNAYATVTVAPPTLTFTANPTRVKKGGSTTITWSGTTGATGCTATGPGLSGSGRTGSQLVTNITATSVYTFTCNGASTTLTVSLLPDYTEE